MNHPQDFYFGLKRLSNNMRGKIKKWQYKMSEPAISDVITSAQAWHSDAQRLEIHDESMNPDFQAAKQELAEAEQHSLNVKRAIVHFAKAVEHLEAAQVQETPESYVSDIDRKSAEAIAGKRYAYNKTNPNLFADLYPIRKQIKSAQVDIEVMGNPHNITAIKSIVTKLQEIAANYGESNPKVKSLVVNAIREINTARNSKSKFVKTRAIKSAVDLIDQLAFSAKMKQEGTYYKPNLASVNIKALVDEVEKLQNIIYRHPFEEPSSLVPAIMRQANVTIKAMKTMGDDPTAARLGRKVIQNLSQVNRFPPVKSAAAHGNYWQHESVKVPFEMALSAIDDLHNYLTRL